MQNNQKLHTTTVSIKRIVNNTVISLVGQGVTWISTLLLTIAYGRFLGDVKFGELYFAITFVGLIGFPIESGFNAQVVREAAQEPEKALRYLSNTLLIKFALWIAFYGILLFVSRLLGYSLEEQILVSICGLTLLFGSFANTYASLFCSFERMIFPVVGSILQNGLSALLGIYLLKSGASVEVMAFVLLGGTLASFLWQAIWFVRIIGIGLVPDIALIRQLIRTSIPFLTYGVIGVIYYRIDTVMLSLMARTAVLGWYGAAYRLFDTLVFLPGIIISTVMYPIFSKLSKNADETLKLALEKSLNVLVFCGVPIAAILLVGAPDIIGFLYHQTEFNNSIPVLQGLAPGLVFLYINSAFAAILMSTNREKKVTIMAAAALVFNVSVNLVLIRLYQHIGAAIATSLTELLLLCLSVVFTPRRLLPFGSLIVSVKAILASLPAALAIYFLQGKLPWQGFNIFVTVPVGIVIYGGAATLLRTIPREDTRVLLSSVLRKARLSVPSTVEDPQEIQTTRQLSEGQFSSVSVEVYSPSNIVSGLSHELTPALLIYEEEEAVTERRPSVQMSLDKFTSTVSKHQEEEETEITEKMPSIPKSIYLREISS